MKYILIKTFSELRKILDSYKLEDLKLLFNSSSSNIIRLLIKKKVSIWYKIKQLTNNIHMVI